MQLGLDAAGMIPGFGAFADVANAGVSLLRGDYAGAAFSIFAAIPGIGDAAAAAKMAKKGATFLEKEIAEEAAKKAAKEAAERAEKEAAERAAKKEAESGGGKIKGKGKDKDGGPCDHQKKGNGKGDYSGGAHAETKLPVGDGLDSHHMPADQVSPLSKNSGPAIQMLPGDHAKTGSNGQMPGSAIYRYEIGQLLAEGKWRDALAKEIRNVRKIANAIQDPKKYNESISEMLKYFHCLEINNLLG